MGDKQALHTFWRRYSYTPDIKTMMLNKDAESIDENDRADVLSTLPDLTGMKIVELGSGIGRFTGYMARKAKHVLATDFMQSFVEKNEELHGSLGNVSFKCVDASGLELDPESCDLVFTNWLLMYLTDADLVQFLINVLRWLTPNGYLHLRESCSESSKRITGTPTAEEASNPTRYRHICQYLTLIDKIRIRDERTGGIMRFEILMSKSIETYVQMVGNWRQLQMLIRKVMCEENEADSSESSVDSLLEIVSKTSISDKISFEEQMQARLRSWQARSPFEKVILDHLKKTSTFTALTSVGNICLDTDANVSPFSIAEELGCFVATLDTCPQLYNYELYEATHKCDKRQRFHWIRDASQNEWHLPKHFFDVVIACCASKHQNLRKLWSNFESLLKPDGTVVLLDRFQENDAKEISKRNGFFKSVDVVDVTAQIHDSLTKAISTLDDTASLLPLINHYQSWLNDEASMKWYLVTARAGH